MRPRIGYIILVVLWVLIPLEAGAASSRRPVITRLDTQFLDNNVNINVHWESPNPVVLVKLLVGPEQKEIKVDEYDNKRNPRGYSGEATVVLNVQPRPGLDFISYVIYLEDDLRQKSEQKSGRAKVPTTLMAQPMPGMPSVQVGVGVQVGVQSGSTPPGLPGAYGPQYGADPSQTGMQPGYTDPQYGTSTGAATGYPTGTQPGYTDPQWGTSTGAATGYPTDSQTGGYPGTPYGSSMGPQSGIQFGTSSGGSTGGQTGTTAMINLTPSQEGTTGTILGVISQVDVPPYFSDIKVNLFQGSNNVTISGKVIDDKGLREIVFRIFDPSGNKVQEQTITNQGRVWQGTTNPFTLSAGKYKVIASAVDLGGNSSKERTADFEITGQGQVVQTPSSAPAMTPEQVQAFSESSSSSSTQTTSSDPQGLTGQPTTPATQ